MYAVCLAPCLAQSVHSAGVVADRISSTWPRALVQCDLDTSHSGVNLFSTFSNLCGPVTALTNGLGQ